MTPDQQSTHGHFWFAQNLSGWTCCLGCWWQLSWFTSAERL